MTDKDFEAYEKLFLSRRDDFVSYSELLKMRPVVAGKYHHAKEKRMADTKYFLREALRVSKTFKKKLKKLRKAH